MIAVIGTCRIKPDMHEQFRSAMLDVISHVHAKEADTICYQLTKSRTDPDIYKVMEIYRSDSALKAHQAAPYFISAGPALIATFAGAPELEFLDVLEAPVLPV